MEKNVYFLALPEWGRGGLPLPEFFGPFSRSAFLVNNKSLFLQKCQCIDLLLYFRLLIYLPSLPTFLQTEKKHQVVRIGVRAGGGVIWFGQCPKENAFFPLMSSLTCMHTISTIKSEFKINSFHGKTASFNETKIKHPSSLWPCFIGTQPGVWEVSMYHRPAVWVVCFPSNRTS